MAEQVERLGLRSCSGGKQVGKSAASYPQGAPVLLITQKMEQFISLMLAGIGNDRWAFSRHGGLRIIKFPPCEAGHAVI